MNDFFYYARQIFIVLLLMCAFAVALYLTLRIIVPEWLFNFLNRSAQIAEPVITTSL